MIRLLRWTYAHTIRHGVQWWRPSYGPLSEQQATVANDGFADIQKAIVRFRAALIAAGVEDAKALTVVTGDLHFLAAREAFRAAHISHRRPKYRLWRASAKRAFRQARAVMSRTFITTVQIASRSEGEDTKS